MSILIRGMEMPKNCGECPFIFTSWGIEYYCHLAESSTSAEYVGREKMTNCPLIELPPHGRLGDLDKLEEQFKRAIETYIPKDPTRHMDVVTSNRCHAWCNGLTVIQDAPTVIEAEGSET